MIDFKKNLTIFFKDSFVLVAFCFWLALMITLYFLWYYLIQSKSLPIYSPITIFPVQYSLLVSFLNISLAFTAIKNNPRASHLLIGLSLFITFLSVLMVIYTNDFFNFAY